MSKNKHYVLQHRFGLFVFIIALKISIKSITDLYEMEGVSLDRWIVLILTFISVPRLAHVMQRLPRRS